MKTGHIKWIAGLALLTLSGCEDENTNLERLKLLATPKIEQYPNGEIIADRLMMIPYLQEQECTKELSPMARLNAKTNSIELCLGNHWFPAFIGTNNWSNHAPVTTEASTKKGQKK